MILDPENLRKCIQWMMWEHDGPYLIGRYEFVEMGPLELRAIFDKQQVFSAYHCKELGIIAYYDATTKTHQYHGEPPSDEVLALLKLSMPRRQLDL